MSVAAREKPKFTLSDIYRAVPQEEMLPILSVDAVISLFCVYLATSRICSDQCHTENKMDIFSFGAALFFGATSCYLHYRIGRRLLNGFEEACNIYRDKVKGYIRAPENTEAIDPAKEFNTPRTIAKLSSACCTTTALASLLSLGISIGLSIYDTRNFNANVAFFSALILANSLGLKIAAADLPDWDATQLQV